MSDRTFGAGIAQVSMTLAVRLRMGLICRGGADANATPLLFLSPFFLGTREAHLGLGVLETRMLIMGCCIASVANTGLKGRHPFPRNKINHLAFAPSRRLPPYPHKGL